MKACEELKKKICKLGAEMMEVDENKVDFDGSYVFYDYDCDEDGDAATADENSMTSTAADDKADLAEKKVSIEDIALKSTFFNNVELQVVQQHSSPISPPPFMVGMVEVEVDTETGNVDVLDYVAAVDCGTPINPNLARVQTEGGIAQESVWHSGKMYSTQTREKSAITPSCSTRFRPDRILEIFVWHSRAVTKRQAHLALNQSENWLLIPRVRQLQKQFTMQQVYV